MNLYLVQHGAAVDKSVDPERPLSTDGVDDVERVASLVGTAGISPARILHSGKARARGTADIFHRRLSAAADPEPVDGIAPMDPVERFADQIHGFEDDVLICGHQPFMGRMVSYLLCADAGKIKIDYQPGSIAALSRDGSGGWRLCWFIRPEFRAGG